MMNPDITKLLTKTAAKVAINIMIEDKIKEILKEELGVLGKLRLEEKLSDYGVDSADVVELLLTIESKFNIEIEVGDIKLDNTISEVITLVDKKIWEKENRFQAVS